MTLSEICAAPEATLNSLDRSELADQCLQWSYLLNPFDNTWALISALVFTGLTGIAVLVHRLVKGADWYVSVLEPLEGLIFGAAAGYAGAAGGMVIAILVPPWFMGLLMSALAVIGLVFAIVASVRGDADAGWIVLAWAHFLGLIALLAVMAAYSFKVGGGSNIADSYHSYLIATGLGLAALSGINAMFASVQRGTFYVIGLVFLVINGSWGFIGNILGLMTHFASLYCYKDFGKLHKGSQRICFVCYEKGISLMSDSAGRFAFTQGAVMSADTNSLRKHEGWHVAQHYIFGPIYPLSHAVWFVVFIIPGLIGSAVKNLGADVGITRMSYYNNPWEVMAYGFANPGARNTSDALIWDWGWSAFVTVIYLLTFVGLFTLWIVLRLV